MTKRLALAFAALVFALTPGFASAQLVSPNAMGVAIGHVHINTTDVDAQTRFWAILGGTILQCEKLTMVQHQT